MINKLEGISKEEKEKYSKLSKERIEEEYNWTKIVKRYEEIF